MNFIDFFFKEDTSNNVLFLTSASLQVCLHTCVCTFIRLLNVAALLSTSCFVEAGILSVGRPYTNNSASEESGTESFRLPSVKLSMSSFSK